MRDGVTYLRIVKRFLPPLLLPLIALALIGNSCEFAAGSRNPPPSAEEGDGGTQNSGLTIVVRSVDSVKQREAQPRGAIVRLLARARSMSVLSSPGEGPPDAMFRSAAEGEGRAESPAVSLAGAMPLRPIAAVPEPSAVLLFSSALCLTWVRIGRR